jgi:hypothetical protein
MTGYRPRAATADRAFPSLEAVYCVGFRHRHADIFSGIAGGSLAQSVRRTLFERFKWRPVTRVLGLPQEWGKHSWKIAKRSPINQTDAQTAAAQALAELDASFFRVRFDRLTPAEKRYLRAMAELGPGPHRSGDIADRLGKRVTAIAPVRNSLITKGMIYSRSHGDTAFTVPLFDGFMRRVMPDGFL